MATAASMERLLRRRLAANVARRRGRLRLTQEEGAELAGMAVRTWQRIEAGEINATLMTLARLAQALQVEPPRLLR